MRDAAGGRAGVVPAVRRGGAHAPGGDATVAGAAGRAGHGDRALAGGSDSGAGVAGGPERLGRHGAVDTDRDGAGWREQPRRRVPPPGRGRTGTQGRTTGAPGTSTRRDDGGRGGTTGAPGSTAPKAGAPRPRRRARAAERAQRPPLRARPAPARAPGPPPMAHGYGRLDDRRLHHGRGAARAPQRRRKPRNAAGKSDPGVRTHAMGRARFFRYTP